uniref:ATP-binding protein n=1 Tax=Paenibacillus sp. FSL E2-0178 TaxID=2921361 RepID=UPI00406CC034
MLAGHSILELIKSVWISVFYLAFTLGPFGIPIPNELLRTESYQDKVDSQLNLKRVDLAQLVQLITDAEYSIIEIENKGIPLSEEKMDRLFERFYKVDYSRKSEGIQTGAGLGLSIARNIAELHRGI